MRRFSSIVISISLLFAVSCSECTTCEPFLEEPFLTIKFLYSADSTERTVIIDSVNQIFANNIRQFQDTTFEYRFPLDMQNDTSSFDLVYRDVSDSVSVFKNRIVLAYSREFFNRDDNYIIVRSDLTDFFTDFAFDNLSCKDNLNNECISNEATARVYY